MIESKNDGRKDLLNKQETIKILLECFKAPKSLKEISIIHDIPIAKIYRIASKLTKYGLIARVDEVKRNGQNISLYRTTSNDIFVKNHEDGLKVRLNFEGNEAKMVKSAI